MGKLYRGNLSAAKLSPSDVYDIRRRYAVGNITQRELAAEYHVSVIQIGRIIRGESWGAYDNPAARAFEDKLYERPKMPAEPDDIDRAAAALEEQTLARMAAEVAKAIEKKEEKDSIDAFLGRDEVAKRTANYGAIHHAERKDDSGRGRADNQDQPQGQSGAEQEQKE